MALRALLIGLGGRGRDWAGTLAAHPRWCLCRGSRTPCPRGGRVALRALLTGRGGRGRDWAGSLAGHPRGELAAAGEPDAAAVVRARDMGVLVGQPCFGSVHEACAAV